MSQKQILSWYRKFELSALRLDLVGDYAGTSRFLIHGDSLLRHCFSDPRIDFSPGAFQLLHAVYVVEQLLQGFVRRKCVFDLVFLKEAAKMCIPTGQTDSCAKWLCAREIVIKHLLGLRREEGQTKVFGSVLDRDCQQWIAERRPLFVMATDGNDSRGAAVVSDDEDSGKDSDSDDASEHGLSGDEQSGAGEAGAAAGDSDDSDADEGNPEKVALCRIRLLLLRFMRLGYNIALLNRVQFDSGKIFTYIIDCSEHTLPLKHEVRGAPAATADPGAAAALPAADGAASPRESLTIHTLVKLLSPNNRRESLGQFASVFLLHTALLRQLSLEQRHPIISPRNHQKATADQFLTCFARIAAALLQDHCLGPAAPAGTGDLCDFVDGRLFLRLVAHGSGKIADPVRSVFLRLSGAVEAGLAAAGCSFKFQLPAAGAGVAMLTSGFQTPTLPLLPFSNPSFDPHLRSIGLEVDDFALDPHLQSIGLELDDSPLDSTASGAVYEEKTHWHNSKKLLTLGVPKKKPATRTILQSAPRGKGQPELDKWTKRQMGRARQREQRHLAQMQRYAASLTNSVNGILGDQKLILCDPKAPPEKQSNPSKRSEKPGTAGKPAKAAKDKRGKPSKPGSTVALSKADQIRLENAEKAAAKETKALLTAWKLLCQELETARDDEGGLERLDEHLKKIQKNLPKDRATPHEARFVELEIRVYKIRLLQKIWVGLLKHGHKQRGFAVLAALFDEARRALSSSVLTIKVQQILENLFKELGIARPPSSLSGAQLIKRDLSFKTKWDGTWGEDFELGMSSEEFQLLHCGPYMDRNMDSKPDPRVPFEPDGWQREVLDELDSDNSVFVVAPTSAGKTFISFHAMEKVLKADDDGLLVYVAPTKALVNQIAAEVISRFRKSYKTTGKTVWAIHTRDYRTNDPNNCQILVTVPHILSIMLLSPTNAEKWAPRVKRIIFDEVHSIGNADDGVVWEQLLLLAPCPIIALSATVGNPQEFNDWLQSTQRSLGFKLSMIKHVHRYSDLRKYVYSPPAPKATRKPFEGLQKCEKFGYMEGAPGLQTIHPVTSLVDASQEIPDDLALEPRDCLMLYKCMKELETEDYRIPVHLDYHRVFGSSGEVIKKAEVIIWEAELKAVLKQWMQDGKSPFKTLTAKLGSRLPTIKEAPQRAETDDGDNLSGDGSGKLKDPLVKWGTLQLLDTLHTENALPALIFSYDRELCASLCASLCKQLEQGEKEWRARDPHWRNKMEKWEAWKKAKASRGSRKTTVIPQGQTKADAMMELAQDEPDALQSFDPADPSPQFSFADTKKCSKAELEAEIEILDPELAASPVVKAFQRGIGIHHAGMNRRYRQAVETLFRKGYLRVVIATGTLALGINMPCKTVIFAGDSVYLTALNFRQAAGRAGRRGFDLLGNVVFHNIALPKAQRLISSRLPSLIGHFPICTSLVLRLFILLHNSKQSEHAKKCINSLLTQPRLILGSDSFKEQMLHHLRFSIEFLRRQQLVGPDGTPLNFAGLITHMYYHEDSAFALHAVLCSKYLHKLCQGIHTPGRRERICREIMLILSNIFLRKPLSKDSKVPRLPLLPKGVRKIVQRYNDATLRTYTTYVETYAKQYCNSADDVLPFSKLRCGGDGAAVGGTARSSFVALSGHTGGFADVADIVASVRSDIFLEGGSVPHLPVTDAGGGLNDYLYSFFKNGDIYKLERDNGIRRSDVWFVLKDFSLVLATIVAGLECHILYGSGAYFNVEDSRDDDDKPALEVPEDAEYRQVLIAFQLVKAEFMEKFKKIFA
ncbi:hypothetical protein FN846DRAFT_923075 [Sphaerosporella brunnea]|uniref:P-loop containing nucleoside triphosphate hydrolase protein n=1 Tax=Sphaerosporella brunnea TaxID=1250544 RepID=A0A5J5EG01_9PEZI|nr:hypothetical protein FN846DRAFT_923075 [Sphaerosporella brunnea]